MKKQLITLAALAGGFVLGASALVALADFGPHQTPPNCDPALDSGCLAPINVGPNDITQVKSDGLTIQGLLGLGSLQFSPGGSSSIVQGSVLTAMDNYGTVGWSSTPAYNTYFLSSVIPVYVHTSDGNVSSVGNDYHSTAVPVSWTTVSASSFGVPTGSNAIILQTRYGTNASPLSEVFARQNSSSPSYVLAVGQAAGSGDSIAGANQTIVPLSSSGSFDYEVLNGFNHGLAIEIVGYIGTQSPTPVNAGTLVCTISTNYVPNGGSRSPASYHTVYSASGSAGGGNGSYSYILNNYLYGYQGLFETTISVPGSIMKASPSGYSTKSGQYITAVSGNTSVNVPCN